MAVFRRGPLTGASNAESMKNRDFRPISRFILEMIQNIAIVTMERQGTRMRSIEWCHCEWPWVTLNDLAKYSVIRSTRGLSVWQLSFLLKTLPWTLVLPVTSTLGDPIPLLSSVCSQCQCFLSCLADYLLPGNTWLTSFSSSECQMMNGSA